ncbi:hypothetical protein OIU76_003732 [Salix suchowensis]|uniref:Uncharacterized protein n=2 Tax=Salix TaxID=40685 RepID=A0A9Q0PW21_9ROSI|nr:hypothetical protein OIU78_013488 [Salix suchowensis]KAJ6347096.1 hypothetical protein OIU76_003732 [Salix suchowensis]KAJ6414822.1 hypothetical protein OIU84_003772 [Salix udensis]KAJ6695114.1 hypothetical protein OIU74_014283 [Salix koriyanagi]
MHPRWVQTPTTTSHSGSLTLAASSCGSRRVATSTLLASLISSSVRLLIKTGFPRHLTVTVEPGSMLERSTSREAMARTSLLADMLRTNLRTKRRIKEAYTNLPPVKTK